MKTFLLSVFAASFALASATAMAQTPPSPPEPPMPPKDGPHMMMKMKMKAPVTKEQHREHVLKMFKHWDTNGDGTVTQAEFLAKHDAKFDKMDANKDGTISKEERQKIREHHKEHRGAKDGSGQ